MHILVETQQTPWAGAQPVEIVERKGLGHPDTICDMLSERLSVALSEHYIDQFGFILHHNVDKALLSAGRSEPAFDAGHILELSFWARNDDGEWQDYPRPRACGGMFSSVAA